jgi:formamidopyrimidine-DNA glycosylase
VPELPEVEVLVRHLKPLLLDKRIEGVQVRRRKVLGTTSASGFSRALLGAQFIGLSRRGKYLVFSLRKPELGDSFLLLGHLGMTGRIFVAPVATPTPKHAAVILNLGPENFVYEDTRYFGRLTLNSAALASLGPEPLTPAFTSESLRQPLQRSRQAIKIKLLDQSVVAGVGNIYASEALFRARISPMKPACRLRPAQVHRLWQALRKVLREAIRSGSTVPLNYAGTGKPDGLFYFGRAAGAPENYQERLRVYDRAGLACFRCGTLIRRKVLAARSTYYCPRCQRN